MKLAYGTAILGCCLIGAFAQTKTPEAALIETYCLGCHGPAKAEASVRLHDFDASHAAKDPELAERVVRQLRARTMPPVGAPRPKDAAYNTVIEHLTAQLDSAVPRAVQPLDDQKLAARLAAFLWSAGPDQPLLEEARRGRLHEPAVLEKQVKRMLADEKANALVTGFFDRWLFVDKLAEVKPNAKLYPEFDEPLRESLRRETELFLAHQLREDRNVAELWTADYTFVNERLARHYGIANVKGAEFRRVNLPNPERAGLLGQGAILTITSHLNSGDMYEAYTSAATRAKWIRTRFLGVNPPPPFPGAQPPPTDKPLSRYARVLPASPCTNCHRNFFPLGYGLENFDTLGRWRTEDGAGPVDASGAMVDGTEFRGASAMRKALLARMDAFHTTLAERVLAYARGGTEAALEPAAPEDMPAVRAIVRDAAKGGYRWSAMIAGVALAVQ